MGLNSINLIQPRASTKEIRSVCRVQTYALFNEGKSAIHTTIMLEGHCCYEPKYWTYLKLSG